MSEFLKPRERAISYICSLGVIGLVVWRAVIGWPYGPFYELIFLVLGVCGVFGLIVPLVDARQEARARLRFYRRRVDPDWEQDQEPDF